MMLGLGERDEEVLEALSALLQAGCRYLSMGQYLSPSAAHVPVARYVQPAEFDQWAQRARDMGFSGVAAGPLIRSSYRAEEMMA
jgi:lipoic acid synthetase